MDITILIKISLTDPGAFEDYHFDWNPLLSRLDLKCALTCERENKINISLKCNPLLDDSLRQQYSAIPPGYPTQHI